MCYIYLTTAFEVYACVLFIFQKIPIWLIWWINVRNSTRKRYITQILSYNSNFMLELAGLGNILLCPQLMMYIEWLLMEHPKAVMGKPYWVRILLPLKCFEHSCSCQSFHLGIALCKHQCCNTHDYSSKGVLYLLWILCCFPIHKVWWKMQGWTLHNLI